MKRNMGNLDRIFRILIAAIIAVLYFAHVVTGALAIVLIIIGVIFLVTGLVSVCPFYTFLGINTCAHKRGKTVV